MPQKAPWPCSAFLGNVQSQDKQKGIAARWLRETLRDHAQGLDVQRGRQPLADYLAESLAWVKDNRALGTYTRYKSVVTATCYPAWEIGGWGNYASRICKTTSPYNSRLACPTASLRLTSPCWE